MNLPINILNKKYTVIEINKGKNFFYLFTSILMSHVLLTGVLTFLNVKLDTAESKTLSAAVISVDVDISKQSRPFRAWFDLPITTSCCFLPESFTTVSISKDEYESFEAGKTKIYLQYRDGFFGLPWLEKSVLLKEE